MKKQEKFPAMPQSTYELLQNVDLHFPILAGNEAGNPLLKTLS